MPRPAAGAAAGAAVAGAVGDRGWRRLRPLDGAWAAGPRRTAERLGGIEADIRRLHGEMPPAEQDLARNPGPRRKVVLATSIAETSLTVPGVRIVIDGGFRRAPRLDPAAGLTRLTTLRISRAAA